MKAFNEWTVSEKFLLLLLMIIAGLKGYSALMSAPNTADAMTYHLARVEHWLQNASVNHYPTSILRQLYSLPWAEYAILHLRALSSLDCFSNTVQWFAFIGSCIATSLLAGLLGSNRRGQLLSAVLVASLPMGLVQSTSTQTDYVLTFWVVTFIYFLWESYREARMIYILAAGASLGLGLLTKGNAFLFSPGWIFIFIFISLWRREFFKLKYVVVVIAIGMIFVLPHSVRNMLVFQKPNWTHMPLTNEDPSLKTVTANFVCNLALHLGTPWKSANQSIKEGLEGVSKLIGFDLHHPDPKPLADEFYFQSLSTGEDDTGNLVFIVLFLLTMIGVLFVPKVRRKELILFGAAILMMIIIFCIVVRYHPWNARYHLTIFVVSTAWVAAVINQGFNWTVVGTGLLSCCLSWPWLLQCNEHPFIGNRSILMTSRVQQYFSEWPQLMLPYSMTMKVVESSGCRDIGLIQSEVGLEYLWWVFLRQKYGQQFRLEQVDVHNTTNQLDYPKGPFRPCLVVADDIREVVALPQGIYVKVWQMDLPFNRASILVPVSKT